MTTSGATTMGPFKGRVEGMPQTRGYDFGVAMHDAMLASSYTNPRWMMVLPVGGEVVEFRFRADDNAEKAWIIAMSRPAMQAPDLSDLVSLGMAMIRHYPRGHRITMHLPPAPPRRAEKMSTHCSSCNGPTTPEERDVFGSRCAWCGPKPHAATRATPRASRSGHLRVERLEEPDTEGDLEAQQLARNLERLGE